MRKLVIAVLMLTACAGTAEQIAPTAAQSGFLPVTDGQIYYEVAGSGPAVVLIHGGFGDRRMWDAQFNDLARDFRVVRYDHRGFGRSPAPTSDSAYSPVLDLVQLLDHLGIDKAHVIGNSVGGALALDFALLRPARVNRVVVVASGATGFPYSRDDVASIVAVFNAAQQLGADSAAARWLVHPMIAVSSRDPRSAELVRQMVWDNRRIFQLQHWPEEKTAPSAYERMGELRMPVLFIIGEQDTEIVRRAAEGTAARVPGAQLWRVPGADHLPQLTAPEAFTRRISEFLQGR